MCHDGVDVADQHLLESGIQPAVWNGQQLLEDAHAVLLSAQLEEEMNGQFQERQHRQSPLVVADQDTKEFRDRVHVNHLVVGLAAKECNDEIT